MRTFEHAAPEYSSLQKEDFKLHERDDAIHDAKFETKSVGFFKDAMLRFGKNTASIIAFIIICIIAFFSILGPMMNEYGYNDQDLNRANLPARIPGCEKINLLNGSTVLKNRRKDNLTDTEKYPEGCILEITNESVVNGVKMCDVRIDTYIYSGYGDDYFWFGTDYLGRDLWTRVWRGCRISLIIAFAAVLTNVGFGVIYGSIAGYYGGMVDMVITGADRVTRRGDAANKIGTYLKALAARDNGVPFYVALPSSTFDLSLRDGVAEIPIEERNPAEVRMMSGETEDGRLENVRICPDSTSARNWAFDVTPGRLITGLITERGVCPATEEGVLSLYPEARV